MTCIQLSKIIKLRLHIFDAYVDTFGVLIILFTRHIFRREIMITLTVKKTKPKTRDRYIAIRMKSELADKIEELAEVTNRSKSDIIDQLLTAMVDRTHIVSEEQE